MPLVNLSLEHFINLSLQNYEKDGVQPLELEQLSEHPNFSDIKKILKALKPNYNTNNVFSLNVQGFTPVGLYGFLLHLKNGLPVLSFGSIADTENPCNDVPVTIEEITTDEDDPDLATTVYRIKAGRCLIKVSPRERAKANTEPNFLLQFGENLSFPLVAKLANDNIKYADFEAVKSIEDLANLLGSIGVLGVKLTDLTRPLVRNNNVKSVINPPLVANVISWECQPPHPDYGVSVLFKIEGIDKALTADGQVIDKPSAVYINDNQLSAKLVQNPNYAVNALLHKYYGGSVQLVITAVNAKNPETNMPNNSLKLVKPSYELAAEQLAKALDFFKANPGVSFSDILAKFPVPAQTKLPEKTDKKAEEKPKKSELKKAIQDEDIQDDPDLIAAIYSGVVDEDIDLESDDLPF